MTREPLPQPSSDPEGMPVLRFRGEIRHWRGPAPYYFVPVPDEGCRDIQDVARAVTYGWGMVPVTVTLGSTTWATSLFPKDGRYLVPVRARVRRAEQVDEGDTVALCVTVAGLTRSGPY